MNCGERVNFPSQPDRVNLTWIRPVQHWSKWKIDPEITSLIGSIILLHSVAENILWQSLPEDVWGDIPRLSRDAKTLGELEARMQEGINSFAEFGGIPPHDASAIITNLQNLIRYVSLVRNTISHGQLFVDMETQIKLTDCGEMARAVENTETSPQFLARQVDLENRLYLTAEALSPAVRNLDFLIEGLVEIVPFASPPPPYLGLPYRRPR